MKKNILLLLAMAMIASLTITAQVAINTDGSSPEGSAILDVKSIDKGLLLPRMTTAERNAISFPVEGLVIYNTDNKSLDLFNGTLWKNTTVDFSCGSQIMDVDSNIYNTIRIGTQCWMAENLKTTTFSNGTPIPNVTDNITWDLLTTGAYVWYDNDITWSEPYGALYNWHATVDPNSLCPIGWHVPTNDEWTVLTDFAGGTDPPHGNKLKSCKQVNSPQGGSCDTTEHPRWDESSENGTDNYGFSSLPGGYRDEDGIFRNIGSHGYSWSSTEYSGGIVAYYRGLIYNYGGVYDGTPWKSMGLSVRCLMD